MSKETYYTLTFEDSSSPVTARLGWFDTKAPSVPLRCRMCSLQNFLSIEYVLYRIYPLLRHHGAGCALGPRARALSPPFSLSLSLSPSLSRMVKHESAVCVSHAHIRARAHTGGAEEVVFRQRRSDGVCLGHEELGLLIRARRSF